LVCTSDTLLGACFCERLDTTDNGGTSGPN
jgi:hypothetical protein